MNVAGDLETDLSTLQTDFQGVADLVANLASGSMLSSEATKLKTDCTTLNTQGGNFNTDQQNCQTAMFNMAQAFLTATSHLGWGSADSNAATFDQAVQHYVTNLNLDGNSALDPNFTLGTFDPISTSTGAFVYDLDVLNVAGPMPLDFSLHYSSLRPRATVLSSGWLGSFDWTLVDRGNSISFIDGTGKEQLFQLQPDDSYQNTYGALEIIKREDDGFSYMPHAGNACKLHTNGRLKEQVDGNGNKLCFSYDEQWRINEAELCPVDGRGKRSLHFTYADGGKLTKIDDDRGHWACLTYDAGKLAGCEQSNGHGYGFAYDDAGHMNAITVDGEAFLTNTYDSKGRVVHQDMADGRAGDLEYDGDKRETVTLGSLGKAIYDFDVALRTVCAKNEQGETHYTYNARSQRIGVLDDKGEKQTLTYDERGNLVSDRSKNGNIRFYYDKHDRMVEKTDAAGIHRYTYDKRGNLITASEPGRQTLKLERDLAGRPTAVAVDDETIFNLTYDDDGQVAVFETNAGDKITYGHDVNGNLIARGDRKGHWGYDTEQRLTQMVDMLNHVFDYAYDGEGHLVSVRRDGKAQHTYEYDDNGNLVRSTDALGQSATNTYDADGRLVERKSAAGLDERFKYDDKDRLVARHMGDAVLGFAYGDGELPHTINSGDGHLGLEFDKYGRPLEVELDGGVKLGYRWDEAGNRLATIYPDGSQANYHYDNHGRMTQVDFAGKSMRYTYDDNGALARVELPGGAEERFGYDPFGHVSLHECSSKGEITDHCVYEYDRDGDLTKRVVERSGLAQEEGTWEYRYDAAKRLVEVMHDGTSVASYAYDGHGNRVSSNDASGKVDYTYDAADCLIAERKDGAERSYEYDADGRLLRTAVNGQDERSFVYDQSGRLSEAAWSGSKATYKYDVYGNLCARITDDKEERFLIDPFAASDNLLSVKRDGAETNYLCTRSAYMASSGASDVMAVTTRDYLGSPMRTLVDDGVATAVYGFDAFGNNLKFADSQANLDGALPFGFTGYIADRAAGGYYAQARRYAPALGRFTSKDILKGSLAEPQSLNEYAYCMNRPASMVDRDGRSPKYAGDDDDDPTEPWDHPGDDGTSVSTPDYGGNPNASLEVHYGGNDTTFNAKEDTITHISKAHSIGNGEEEASVSEFKASSNASIGAGTVIIDKTHNTDTTTMVSVDANGSTTTTVSIANDKKPLNDRDHDYGYSEVVTTISKTVKPPKPQPELEPVPEPAPETNLAPVLGKAAAGAILLFIFGKLVEGAIAIGTGGLGAPALLIPTAYNPNDPASVQSGVYNFSGPNCGKANTVLC
jgi:RHS repeat-associated protein